MAYVTTRETCAHYDDGISDPESGMFSRKAGTCLFAKQNWSPAANPKRCKGCPDAMLAEREKRDA